MGPIPGIDSLSDNVKILMQREAAVKAANERHQKFMLGSPDPKVRALADPNLTPEQRAALPAPDYFAPISKEEQARVAAYIKESEAASGKVSAPSTPAAPAKPASTSPVAQKSSKPTIAKTPTYSRPAAAPGKPAAKGNVADKSPTKPSTKPAAPKPDAPSTRAYQRMGGAETKKYLEQLSEASPVVSGKAGNKKRDQIKRDIMLEERRAMDNRLLDNMVKESRAKKAKAEKDRGFRFITATPYGPNPFIDRLNKVQRQQDKADYDKYAKPFVDADNKKIKRMEYNRTTMANQRRFHANQPTKPAPYMPATAGQYSIPASGLAFKPITPANRKQAVIKKDWK